MRQGRTLQEVAAELDRQMATKADYVADTRRLQLSSNGTSTITIDGVGEGGELGEFGVTDLAHAQIADRLKVPKAFYDRMRSGHPGILDSIVNGLFTQAPEKRLVRTLDGRARAFLSDRYRIIDNYDLAQVVLPILGDMPDARFESIELTEKRFYIKTVLPKFEGEVKVGEPVQYGLLVSNSEVGWGALQVAPFLYVLSCRNGMVSTQFGQKRYHLGRAASGEEEAYRIFRDETLAADDKAFWMKVEDAVRAAADETVFNQIVQQCEHLTTVSIEGSPVDAVERLTDKIQLTDDEKGNVLNHLISGGDLTGWGLVQAVTRTAQDVADYDRATELERAGGDVLEWEDAALAKVLVG